LKRISFDCYMIAKSKNLQIMFFDILLNN